MTRKEFMHKYINKAHQELTDGLMLEFFDDLDTVIRIEAGEVKDLGVIQKVKHDYKIMYDQALEAKQVNASELIKTYVATISNYRMDRIASKADPPTLKDFVKWSKEYNTAILAQVMCDLENWDLKEFKKKKSLRLTINNWMNRSKGRVVRGVNPPMTQV